MTSRKSAKSSPQNKPPAPVVAAPSYYSLTTYWAVDGGVPTLEETYFASASDVIAWLKANGYATAAPETSSQGSR